MSALCTLLVFGTLSAARNASADTTLRSERGLALRDVIRATLAQQATIALGREQFNQSDAAITLTRADFDWTVESSLNHGADYRPTGSSTFYDRILTTTFDTRLVKKSEYGFSLEPGVQLTRTMSDTTSDNGGASETTTALRVSFNLVVPLLQGSGKTVVTAREAAARYDYEATRQELLHSISQAVYESIAAYWNYVAAAERLQLAIAAEQRAGSVVANTVSLVNADEVPQAEQINAQANQLEKKISRERAELSVLEARQQLGLLMGITAEESSVLPLPTGKLPIVGPVAAQSSREKQQQIITAAGRRNDLLALMQRLKSAEKLVIAARDTLDPKLDLLSGIGYDGYQSGASLQRSLQTFETRQQYPDWSVGLRFSYPLENSRARGSYAIASSQRMQSSIKIREMQRGIETSLRTILQSMQNVAREIETADQTVESYQKAVSNEREKYLMGESTLFDLLFTQDKLESAQLMRTDTHLNGALLLTRLQFESAGMLTCQGEACDLNPDAAILLSAPQHEAK
ncbi:MAG TPA: TolC family protein [Desulfuromonadales bacterium]|nr:TolC family protein [Desulfuromonadales bacterium]